MEINKAILEQKRQELIQKLSTASPSESGALLSQIQKLVALQTSYEALCADFEALFSVRQRSIEIKITDGALSENYLNLREAVNQGLVAVGQTIRISFPGTKLNSIESDVKSNGYLRDRSAARLFFEYTDIRNGDRRVLFTRTGSNEYALESAAPSAGFRPSVLSAGRLSPFQFSKCGIEAGAQVAFLDDPDIVCTVCDDKHVLYEGQRYSLSKLAMKLRNTSVPLAGPRFFTYQGELLCDRRDRLESAGQTR